MGGLEGRVLALPDVLDELYGIPKSLKGYGVAVAGAGNTQKPAHFSTIGWRFRRPPMKCGIFKTVLPWEAVFGKSPRIRRKMGAEPPGGQMARVAPGRATGPTKTLQRL